MNIRNQRAKADIGDQVQPQPTAQPQPQPMPQFQPQPQPKFQFQPEPDVQPPVNPQANNNQQVENGADAHQEQVNDTLSKICQEVGIKIDGEMKVNDVDGKGKKRKTKVKTDNKSKEKGNKKGRKRKAEVQDGGVAKSIAMKKSDAIGGESDAIGDASNRSVQEMEVSDGSQQNGKKGVIDGKSRFTVNTIQKIDVPIAGNSEVPVEIQVASQSATSDQVVILLYDSSYPKITLVRRKEFEEDRTFFLTKVETNTLMSITDDLQEIIDNTDMEKQLNLSHKTYIQLTMYNGQKKVTFVTKTNAGRNFFFNFSVNEFLDFLLGVVNLKQRRNMLIEIEGNLNSPSKAIDGEKLIFCHQLVYNLLDTDMIRLIVDQKTGKPAEFTRTFVTPEDMYHLMDDAQVMTRKVTKITVQLPNPAWVAHAILRTLAGSGIQSTETSYTEVAASVQKFYEKVAPGYISPKQILDSSKNVVKSYFFYPDLFLNEIAGVIKNNYGTNEIVPKIEYLPTLPRK